MAITDQSEEVPAPSPLQKFFKDLGPGVITGAADDDPSGISTYSVAGATFGYTGLWTALFTFPLMAAVQLMCARLGMVTGQGLAAVIRKRYSRWILWPSCALLLIANIFNIGADLGGMADAMQMVTGVQAYFWTPLFACAIVALLFLTSYRAMARVLKWLTLVLFAYVITAFLAQPDWSAVLRATFIPHIEWTRSFMSVLVGIFGTTISPYLFFWQAAEQVEEDREHGKSSVAQRRGSSGYPSTQNTGRFVPREEPDHHRHRSLDRRFLGRLHPAVHQGEALGAIGLCTWPAVL